MYSKTRFFECPAGLTGNEVVSKSTDYGMTTQLYRYNRHIEEACKVGKYLEYSSNFPQILETPLPTIPVHELHLRIWK